MKVVLHVDGGARGNPGPAAAAAVVSNEGGEVLDEAAELLGVRSFSGWSSGERAWWRRWAPLVLLLPGVARWSSGERRRLTAVIRAKGGVREDEFVRRFDAHRRLRAAIRRLARATPPA